MTDLNDYLAQKRDALSQRAGRIETGELGVQRISARVEAAGRSGIRRIRIRDFQLLTDSPEDFAGYDLGPSSPELQLGVLGSCLTHSYLIQAALLGVPLESLEVELTGQLDARAGHPDHPDTPVFPHDLGYVVRIASPASDAEIGKLREAVEKRCPILNLLQKPQQIRSAIEHLPPSRTAAPFIDKAA